MKIKCRMCENMIQTYPSVIKQGRSKFCSKTCKNKSQIKVRDIYYCKKCSRKLLYRQKEYCSRECRLPWNKGLTIETDFRIKHPTRDQIRKCLARRSMSSLETKLQSFIDKYKLDYRFVGNGKFFIEKINPDFVNINGKKIAVEVYCRRHKERFRNKTVNEWKLERSIKVNQYGWQMIFFDETELNELNVINKLV